MKKNSNGNEVKNKGKYITLRREANASFEEKHSVFIGHAGPFTTEEAASKFIRRIKAEHSDATHNVYAYLIRGGAVARYSDDGEPQGTAGMPVLDVIKKSGCDDVCVVITRYFGGTLLGAGGLVRAYTEAARLALEAAEIVVYEPYTVLRLTCSYSDYQKIVPETAKADAIIDNTDFMESVILTTAVRTEFLDEFTDRISELTAGRITIEKISERFDCSQTA